MDRSVQILFVALLIGVLVLSVCILAVMGVGRHCRVVALARQAHRMRMRFSPGDPFDVPRRYAAFDLIRSGHSPHANNVTHGQLSGWALRAFDFRYELGHGMRRLTRQYGVIVIETNRPLGSVLLWHEGDRQDGPGATRPHRRRHACWICQGPEDLAARLAELCWPVAGDRASIQTCGSVLMFCLPSRGRWPDYAAGLEKVGAILEGLGARVPAPAPEAG